MKKLPDRYIYPAVFTYDDNGEIGVVFPDLPAATSGIDENDALLSARECLGCVLCGMEEDGETIPKPSTLKDIKLSKNEYAMLIDVYMPSIRMAEINKSVNRTVTLPAWLNAKALEYNMNFSQLLQEAIKQQLNMQ